MARPRPRGANELPRRTGSIACRLGRPDRLSGRSSSPHTVRRQQWALRAGVLALPDDGGARDLQGGFGEEDVGGRAEVGGGGEVGDGDLVRAGAEEVGGEGEGDGAPVGVVAGADAVPVMERARPGKDAPGVDLQGDLVRLVPLVVEPGDREDYRAARLRAEREGEGRPRVIAEGTVDGNPGSAVVAAVAPIKAADPILRGEGGPGDGQRGRGR